MMPLPAPCLPRAATLSAFALFLCAAKASAQTITYDWRESDLLTSPQLKSGAELRLRIVGISAFCYDYEVSVTQVGTADAPGDIIGLFSGTAIPKGVGPDAPATGPAPASTPDNDAHRRLGAIEDTLTQVEARVTAAVNSVNAVSDAHSAASEGVSALHAFACPGGGSRGRSVSAASVELTTARQRLTALLAKLPEVAIADTNIVRAVVLLEVARERLAQFPTRSATEAAPNEAIRLSAAATRQAAAKAQIEALRSGPLAAAKKLTAAQVNAAIADLNQSVADTMIQRSLIVRSNTDSILVVIRAKGKPDVPSMKGVVLTDLLSIPVRRTHRTFMSGGFLMSSLDEHRFVRANRSAGVAASPDSTYSTLVDTRNSGSTAFAPGVLINTTLWQVRGFDISLSAGVAARSVNNRVSPDYLLGFSVGVQDRVVITPAFHFGRVEKLLLGDPVTVMGAPVPQAVTLDMAVGEKWITAFGLVISYRL